VGELKNEGVLLATDDSHRYRVFLPEQEE